MDTDTGITKSSIHPQRYEYEREVVNKICTDQSTILPKHVNRTLNVVHEHLALIVQLLCV